MFTNYSFKNNTSQKQLSITVEQDNKAQTPCSNKIVKLKGVIGLLFLDHRLLV